MRVGIQTWGSEGDIRPFLALAAGLARAGHRVRLVVIGSPHSEYTDAARVAGVDIGIVPVPGLESAEALDRFSRLVLAAGNPFRQAELILKFGFDPAIEAMEAEARELCAASDLVTGHFFVHPLQAAAESVRLPFVAVHLAHSGIPSARIRPPGLPAMPPFLNPLLWRLARFGINRIFRGRVNMTRARFRLPSIRDVTSQVWSSRLLTLAAVSRCFVPEPSGWPPNHHACGFLDFRASNQDPESDGQMEQFLAGGDPPVFFTYGSMLSPNVAEIRKAESIWCEAARLAGCRAILQLPAGISGSGVLAIPRCHHAAVFPRCSAVVHHGGAGTTHAALRAGTPSVVVPHLADQFFWAEEVARLGLGVGCRPEDRMRPDRLATAIRLVLGNRTMLAGVKRTAAQINGEDGVQRAVELIESLGVQERINR